MSNRYFYYLLVAATTLLMLGCATHPPAHIIDDRYINFEYGYSIEVPEGWAVHERAPAKILKNFGWKRREVSLLFFNEETYCAIALMNIKKEYLYEDLLYLNTEQLDNIVVSMQKKAAENKKWDDYTVKIIKSNLNHTNIRYQNNPKSFKPSKVFTIAFTIDGNELQVREYGDLYLYPCNGEKVCATAVVLGCRRDNFDKNRPVFNVTSDSFLGHNNRNQ